MIAIGVLCSAAVGGITLTDRPEVRYAEYRHHLPIIYGERGGVDLAVLGSSRSMRAFQADLLTDAVEETHGFRPVIYDLSRAWRDLGHMTVITRDVLAERRVRMLLIELKETGNQWRHPYFERTTELADIVESFSSRPSVPVFQRLHEQVWLLLTRASHRVTLALKRQIRDFPTKKVKAASRDPSRPFFVKPDLLAIAKAEKGGTWQDAQARTIDLDSAEEERSRFYIDKLVRLARENGTKLHFYHVPRLFDPPLSEAFVRDFEGRFGVPLIQLSRDELREAYDEGYTDPTHMGRKSAEIWKRKLRDELTWRADRD